MSLWSEIQKIQKNVKVTRELLDRFGKALRKPERNAIEHVIEGQTHAAAAHQARITPRELEAAISTLRGLQLRAEGEARMATMGQPAQVDYRIEPRRFKPLTKGEMRELFHETKLTHKWEGDAMQGAKLVLCEHASIEDVAKLLKVEYGTIARVVEKIEKVMERRIQDEFE